MANPAGWRCVAIIALIVAAQSANITVHPAFINNGDYVDVRWNFLAEDSDWIGLFTLGDDRPFDVYNPLDEVTQLTVKLFNLGSNYAFRYYRNESMLAESQVHVDLYEVLQVRLALTGKENEMRITWITRLNISHPIKVALANGEPTIDVTVTTYGSEDLCEVDTSATGFRNPGFIHTATVSRVACHGCVEACVYTIGSRSGSFRLGNPSEVHFVALADMGTNFRPTFWNHPGAIHTMHMIANDPLTDFVIVPGDLSYAVGHGHLWDYWDTLIEPYASKVPNMIGVGNHEFDWPTKDTNPVWGTHGTDSHGECGIPFERRYSMPTGGNGNYWYSFDYSVVHVVMISTEHDVRPGSAQYEWLAKDLGRVDRSKTPWVIVSGHRPLYLGETGQDFDVMVSLLLRDALEDLLYLSKVDFVIVGHVHSYERTCPVYRGVCTEGAPMHMIVGTGGATVETGEFVPKWAVAGTNEWGVGKIHATKSALVFEFVFPNGTIHDCAFRRAPRATGGSTGDVPIGCSEVF